MATDPTSVHFSFNFFNEILIKDLNLTRQWIKISFYIYLRHIPIIFIKSDTELKNEIKQMENMQGLLSTVYCLLSTAMGRSSFKRPDNKLASDTEN